MKTVFLKGPICRSGLGTRLKWVITVVIFANSTLDGLAAVDPKPLNTVPGTPKGPIQTDLKSNLSAPQASSPGQKTQTEPKLLSDVTRGYLGIDEEPAESRQAVMAQALKFLKYRKRAMPTSERAAFEKSCASDPQKPFCQELQEVLSQKSASNRARKPTKNRKSPNANQFAQWIREAQDDKLHELSPDDLRAGLRKIKQNGDIEDLANKLLSDSKCTHPFVTALLGQKMEEFLPEDTYRKKAIQLYEKSIQCEKALDEASLRARHRLSLLKIWENDCSGALPHLKFLTENAIPPTDYSPNAYFWQYQCGTQLKKDDLAKQAKQAVLQKFPFSLQTVLIQSDDPSSSAKMVQRQDSPIQTRLSENSPLNLRIRDIEALLRLKETGYARELLIRLESQLEPGVPQFKLYLAALYSRVDEANRRFRILNSIFKEDSTLVSKAALELFYPHKSELTARGQIASIDTMLLHSLIRQESAFNSRARSPAGALGLMQVMPGTARKMMRLRNANQLYNPNINLEVGSRYFALLLRNFEGDAELALAAYNAGPKRVEEWLRRYPVKDRALFIDLIPFRETRDYVSAIARNYFWYVSLYSKPQSDLEENRKNLGKFFNLFKS